MAADINPGGAFQGGRDLDRSIDPWTELAHANNGFEYRLRTRKPGNFSLYTCEHPPGQITDQWGQIQLSYADNTRNTIELEVQMQNAVSAGTDLSRYNNTVMDQEEVVLGIKNTLADQAFKVAKGSDFDSKFIISPVGAKKIYPARMYDPNKYHGGIYGDPLTNGISPFTYRDNVGFHPHDHYFIADFYARLHKEDKQLPDTSLRLAFYPWDAYYPDGDYQFRPNVLDVDGTWYPMPDPKDFEIDNFKPFIRTVSITSGSGTPDDERIYYREWAPVSPEGTVRLSGVTCKQPASLTNQVITIYAAATESLRRLRAYIWDVTGWVEGTPMPYDLAEPESWGNQRWKIQFNNLLLINDQCYQVVFDGEDLYGNVVGEGHRLLSPEVGLNCNADTGFGFAIPYRTSTSTWTAGPPEDEDWVHKFKVNDCGQQIAPTNSTAECFTARDVAYDITYAEAQMPTGAIFMSVTGGTNGMSFIWTDQAGNVVGQSKDLVNVPAGQYCVEVKYGCCSFLDCIEVGACGLAVSVSLEHPRTGASNGSITLAPTNGSEPYLFHWSNGASSNPLTGLSAGVYTVTATDAHHCSVIKTITLTQCPDIQLAPNAVLHLPSACDSTDGGIQLLAPNPSGGVSPYSYFWTDETGAGLNSPSNIGPGAYFLVAVDANGCTGSYYFILRPEHYPEITPTILSSCGENGYLGLYAFDPEGGQYNFTWEDGSGDLSTYSSERGNLSPGWYCVTISSDVTDCAVEKCYEVPETIPEFSLDVSSSYLNPCPDDANGGINLSIVGGISPYEIQWSDNPWPPNQTNRGGLSPGIYAVTVTDFCGSEVVQNFSLVPLDLQTIQAISGCVGQGQVLAAAVNGNPPYSFSWNTGGNGSLIQNLQPGDYCVTATDAAGCTAVGCTALQNKTYKVTRSHPCHGMSDGVISVEINNPAQGPVNISLDGGMIYQNPNAAAHFTFDIPSLNGDSSVYQLVVEIDGCIYPSSQLLQNKSTVISFDRYENGLCYYNEKCDGVLIPGSETVQEPTIDETNGDGGWLTECKFPIKCGSLHVDDKHVDKITVRAAEYEQILLMAYNYFPTDIVDARLTAFWNMSYLDCDKIRFCPASLKVTSVWHTAGIAGNATADPNAPGCYRLKCCLFGIENENFCISEITPSIFTELQGGGTTVSACNPASQNLYQLIFWEDQLAQHYGPLFYNSELYINFIFPFRNDPRAKCANIVYCTEDFSVLIAPDMNAIDCDDPPIGCDFVNWAGFGEGAGGCWPYACVDDYFAEELSLMSNGEIVTFLGHLEWVCEEFPGHFLAPDDDDVTKFVSNPPGGGHFVRFGKAVHEERTAPKGITRFGADNKFFDYASSTRMDRSETVPDLEYFIDNWDEGYIANVRKIESERRYLIEYQKETETWSSFLLSDSLVNVRYFDWQDSLLVIGGDFIGSLSYESVQLSDQDMNTGFVVQLGFDGHLVSFTTVRNLDTRMPIKFSKGDGGVFIFGRATGQSVILNNTSVPVQEGAIASILITPNAIIPSVSGFTIDTSIILLKATQSKDGEKTIYLLNGQGNINTGQGMVNSAGGQNLILVTADTLGTVQWTQIIEGQQLVDKKVDLVYGSGSDAYLGITFADSLSLSVGTIFSNGGNDIVFLKYNEEGELEGYRNFGSIHDEDLSELFFADSILYFGGDFSGFTLTREIGAHQFVNLSNSASNPYISYIPEGYLNGFSEQTMPGALSNRQNSSEFESFAVYPNPFSDELFIRLISVTSDLYSIKLIDALGKIVEVRNENSETGLNLYRIKHLSKMPSGVYYVQITNSLGITRTQKVVKS